MGGLQLVKAKNTAENFRKMLVERPEDAIKYVQKFEKNPFWQYYKSKMAAELAECDVKLRSCSLDQVVFIRGFRHGIEHRVTMPDKLVDQLKDDIAIKKEAAKIEAARQPQEESKE